MDSFWSYQGAKNSTSAGLFDSKTILSKLEGMRFVTADAAAATAKRRGESRTILCILSVPFAKCNKEVRRDNKRMKGLLVCPISLYVAAISSTGEFPSISEARCLQVQFTATNKRAGSALRHWLAIAALA